MNPFLEALNLPADGKALILHADDVGMCHASLAAFAELHERFPAVSGSVMVPAPWFQATAAFAREHPDADLGLHITLTCEWGGYRWSALSTRDPGSGLLDEQGCFPRNQVPLWEKAGVGAALLEIEAQLRTAHAAGIELTHVDDHMGVWGHPRFALHFARFCLRHRLPARYVSPAREGVGLDEWETAQRDASALYAGGGLPWFDRIGGLPLDDQDSHEERILGFSEALPTGGLGLIVGHPALDTPELRALAPDWRGRAANFRAFNSKRVHEALSRRGVLLINYRDLNRIE